MIENMSNRYQKHITMDQIYRKIIQQDDNISQDVCESVWDKFIRAIITLSDEKKSLLVFDMFYINSVRQGKAVSYRWMPTLSLSEQLQLRINMTERINCIVNFTSSKFYKFAGNQEQSNKTIQKETSWIILSNIFNEIKLGLKKNTEIILQYFGTLCIINSELKHIFKENQQQIRIRQLITPKRRSSMLRSQKKIAVDAGIKRQNMYPGRQSLDKSLFSEKSKLSARRLSPLQELYASQTINNSIFKQKRWINELTVPDTNIPDDLLGAGIDPLKFDYNYSKLVKDSSKLLYKTFMKPKDAKMRHPGIIDKFQRTNGVPQAGLKVSSSIVVRIGSNYNPHAKHLYADISLRCIMNVPKQLKINLKAKKQIKTLIPASQIEQYNYVTKDEMQLKQKVELRHKIYKRYMKYLRLYIDNNNVCPMSHDSIKAILQQLHISGQGKNRNNQYFKITESSINEANEIYYEANKKSILDYILKDEGERQRIGISIIFRSPIQWGQRKQKQILSERKKQQKDRISKKLQGFLCFPKCIMQITENNLKILQIDLFRINTHSNKPVNILYFIKKQRTQTSEIITYLGSEWVKNIVEIIKKHISISAFSEQKINTFMKLINVILSNTLKSIILNSLVKLKYFFQRFSVQVQKQQAPILQVSIADKNGIFILTDNFRKILTQELALIIKNVITETAKIHSIQFYLRDEPNSYLNVLTQEDESCAQANNQILAVIDENCELIEKFLQKLEFASKILRYKEQMVEWMKSQHSISQIKQQLKQIAQMQKIVEQIPHYYQKKMFLVECFEEKQKLIFYLNSIKIKIYQNLQNQIKNSNLKSFRQIEEIRQAISASIESPSDYLKVWGEIEEIKQKKIIEINNEMVINREILSYLHQIGYGFISADIVHKIYRTNVAHRNIPSKIKYHQERLQKEKLKLQNNLKAKIQEFESKTANQVSSISARIQQFEIRRIYNDYLIEMHTFKHLVEQNQQIAKELYRQQENLKWKSIEFKSAEQLKTLIFPTLQLWELVAQFDALMRQWKSLPISKMDAKIVRQKIKKIYEKTFKLQLKNLSGMKVASQLQSDSREILNQQLEIIQIFSHPGLKDRHWQVFNTKLMIPGYDLKQITYSKIKIFYQYEKSLQIISIISKQAAREYQIELQKNLQQDFWSSVSFITQTSKIDNIFCISQRFLDQHEQILYENATKLSVMKNYLYSKTLYQQLSQWEVWLGNSHKLLQNIIKIQHQYLKIKGLFLNEPIAKQLPVEYSQFQSIQLGWKSISKKIFQHSKFIDFSKSPKIIQYTEELCHKIQIVKLGIPEFLKIKRAQYPRFYLIDDQKFIQILSNNDLETAFAECFTKKVQLIHNEDKIIQLQSPLDCLLITNQVLRVKSKKKVCQTMNLIETCMKTSLKDQIQIIIRYDLFRDLKRITKDFCLSAIFCAFNIQFTKEMEQLQNNDLASLLNQKSKIIKQLLQLIKNDRQSLQKNSCVIVSFIAQIQRLNYLARLEGNSKDSYQFYSQVKFHMHGEQQTNTVSSPQNQDKCPKIKKLYKKICQNRRNSINRKSDSSKIVIQFFERKISYGLEYWGSQADNFRSVELEKFAVKIFDRSNFQSITHLSCKKSSLLTYSLASQCGLFYKPIQEQCFFTQQGFDLFLKGFISSGIWVFINCQQIRLKQWHFSSLNNLIQQMHSKAKSETNNKKQIFVNKFNQIIDTEFNSSLFIFSQNQQFEQIPESYRTRMRTICLHVPSVLVNNTFQILKHENIEIAAKIQLALNFTQLYRNSFNKNITSFRTYDTINAIESGQNIHSIKNKTFQQFLKKFYLQQNWLQVEKIYENFGIHREKNEKQLDENNHEGVLKLETFLSKQKITMSQIYQDIKQNFCLKMKQNKPIIFYGSLDIKQKVIVSCLQSYQNINPKFYSFPMSTILNHPQSYLTHITKNIVYELKTIHKKFIKKQSLQNHEMNIYIWLQFETSMEELNFKTIQAAASKVQQNKGILQKLELQKFNLIIIYDCISIENLSPFTLFEVTLVAADSPNNIQFGPLMSSLLKEQLENQAKKDGDSINNNSQVFYQVQSMEYSFQTILSSVMKAKPADIAYKPTSITKITLINNFISLFKLFLAQTKKGIDDSCCEFDLVTYIRNSFVYCLYWSLCIGYVHERDHALIQQIILKDHFSEITEIQSISKYFLNEQNQWLIWDSLRQGMTLTPNKNGHSYNMWISTENNMRIYINLIKLVESNASLILLGKQSSGKSTILRELSNFQISKDSFLLNCHRKTSPKFVTDLIQNQIYYKSNQQKIVLIDDLNLPESEKSIGQIFKKILLEKQLACSNDKGIITNKKIEFSSLIASFYSGNQSLRLLKNSCHTIHLSTMSDNEVKSISNAYIMHELQKTSNIQSQEHLSHISLSFLMKIHHKAALSIEESLQIIKILISKLSPYYKDSSSDVVKQPSNSLDASNFLGMLTVAMDIVIKDFRQPTLLKYCADEITKLTGESSKDKNNFIEQIHKNLFARLPPLLQDQSIGNSPHKKLSDIEKIVQNLLFQKEQFQFIATAFNIQLIFKILQIVKVIPSHIIIISNGSFGIRTIVRIASLLENLAYNQIQKDNTQGLISDCLNIIKVGGRIDQSSYYLSKNIYESIQDSDFMTLINSFASQPELHSFFTEKRIEQVFVKFSSEKKTLRRNEFVKKMKQKINQLFHFFISVDSKNFVHLSNNFASLVKNSFKINISNCPSESLVSFGKKTLQCHGASNFIGTQLEGQSPKIIKAMLSINKQFLQLRESLRTKGLSKNSFIFLYQDIKIIQYFKNFIILLKRLQNVNKNEQMNSEVWESRSKESQKKYEALLQEKQRLTKGNEDYFTKIHAYSQELEQKQMKIHYLNEQYKMQEHQKNSIQESLKIFHAQQQSNIYGSIPYETMLTIEAQMLDQKEFHNFQKIYKTEIFNKMREFAQLKGSSMLQIDIRSVILQTLDTIRSSNSAYIRQIFEDYTEKIINSESQIQKVMTLFENWIAQKKQLFQIAKRSQESVKSMEEQIEKKSLKMEQTKAELAELEQEISTIKENYQQNTFPESQSLQKQYEQICKAISQVEPILKIFSHFQSVIKNRKKQNNRYQRIQIKNYVGNVIMAAAFIQFGFYIDDEYLGEFLANAQEIIIENNIALNQQRRFENFLSKEQIFKYKHIVTEKVQSHIMAHIAISSNLCTAFSVNSSEKIFDFYDFITEMNIEAKVKLVEDSDLYEISNYLSSGKIIVIVNPSDYIFKKLKPLIENQGEVRDNKVHVKIEQQIILHHETRVVFVFTNKNEVAPQKYSEYLSDIWLIKFINRELPIDYTIKKIKKKINGIHTKITATIDQYLLNCQELYCIENKIQNIIMNMRKNFDNPENIIVKIEAVSEEKDKIVTKMDQLAEALDQYEAKQSQDSADDTLFNHIKSKHELFRNQYQSKIAYHFLNFLKIINQKSPLKLNQDKTEFLTLIDAYTSFIKPMGAQRIMPLNRQDYLQAILDAQKQDNISNRKVYWQKILTMIFAEQKNKGKREANMNHDILIVQTNEIKVIEEYISNRLIQIHREVQKCQLSLLTELSLTPSVKERIFIINVNYQSQWNLIITFLKQQQLKSIASRIVIICASHLQIPYTLQLMSVVLQNQFEYFDVIDTIFTCDGNREQIEKLLNLKGDKIESVSLATQYLQYYLQIKSTNAAKPYIVEHLNQILN